MKPKFRTPLKSSSPKTSPSKSPSSPKPPKPQPKKTTLTEAGWVVGEDRAGMPLQDFLALAMDASKRVAKQHIDAKVVRVNGQTV